MSVEGDLHETARPLGELLGRARRQVQRELSCARAPWWLAGLAVMLSLPSLRMGLVTDEHMLLDKRPCPRQAPSAS